MSYRKLLLTWLASRALSTAASSSSRIAVSVFKPSLISRLQLPASFLKEESALKAERDLVLDYVDDTGSAQQPKLALRWGPASQVKESPFSIDFNDARMRQRLKSCKQEACVKAVGADCGLVVDMTAGLGRDALLLASAGTPVLLCERNVVIYHLLRDALLRLDDHAPSLVARTRLLLMDSSDAGAAAALRTHCDELVAVTTASTSAISVYLDPMYPAGVVGRRAKVKKETQMLHRIVPEVSATQREIDDRTLWTQAMRIATNRVVVKRPLKGEYLCGETPEHSLIGSTHRFDVYRPQL